MKRRSASKSFRHLEDLEINAVFSDCGKYRYLMNIKKAGEISGKEVCTVMLNPSVADEQQADKSVQFLEKLVFNKPSPYLNNISKLSIVNLFAYIQTHNFQGSPKQIGPLNDDYIRKAISEADMVLIAWGKTCTHTERQQVVLDLLREFPKKLVFITKSHPSRGTYKDFVSPFNPKGKGP